MHLLEISSSSSVARILPWSPQADPVAAVAGGAAAVTGDRRLCLAMAVRKQIQDRL